MWNYLLGCARITHRNTKQKGRTHLFGRFTVFGPIREFHPVIAYEREVDAGEAGSHPGEQSLTSKAHNTPILTWYGTP
jgi:hypothetical protein